MNRIVLYFSLFTFAMVSFSCEKSNPVENAKPTLTASENPVMIAIGVQWSKSITITGGSGGYFVKSNSDTTVISATYSSFQSSAKAVSITGKKIGTAKIIIQDSAKTAEVEISITVATMASSPSSVTIQVERTKYVYIQGGTSPYSIDQAANSAIASVNLFGSSMNVQGIAQGSTSVVVKDNATPPNKVTISITVIPKPVFTTAGKISFSSNKGDFSVNGILAENIVTAAANSEGAGGQIPIGLSSSSFGYIIGYKKKSQNIIDIVSIVFVKKTLSQGTLAIDSSRNLGYDTAVVRIAFGADLNSQTPDSYVLHTGSLTFSVLNTQKATGTFSGAGTLIRNNVPVAGNTVSVTNGMFDVPLLVEDFGLANKSAEQERILGFAKKLIEKDLMKMKLNRE